MTRALVLHSGGADSTLMMVLARRMGREVTPLMFDYGQKHDEELNYGKSIIKYLQGCGVLADRKINEPMVVDLKGAFYWNASNLLKNPAQDVELKYPGVHPMHVPGRNSIFLSVALGIAESQLHDEIWIGCDFSDRLGLFPDCYQEWLVKMREAMLVAGSRKVEVKAPLLGMTKEDVLALLKSEGVTKDMLHSGYSAPTTTVEVQLNRPTT